MRPKRKPLPTHWKRRAGAEKTPQKCWASVTRRCSTRCGSLTWIHRARGDPLWHLRLRRRLPLLERDAIRTARPRGIFPRSNRDGSGFQAVLYGSRSATHSKKMVPGSPELSYFVLQHMAYGEVRGTGEAGARTGRPPGL